MRDNDPKPPVEKRSSFQLLDDICVALRSIGGDYYTPNPIDIQIVQEIHAELSKRAVDISPRINELCEITKWQVDVLLQDCLTYPEVMPYVRGRDGVRNVLRCWLCQKQEFPDFKGLPLCDACLNETLTALQCRRPMDGFLLYRSYSPSSWCRHADAETVLMAFDEYTSGDRAWCEQCVVEEQKLRAEIKMQAGV